MISELVIDAFKTPIFDVQTTINTQSLIDYAYELKNKSKGRVISNVSGWQSDELNKDLPILNELKNTINEGTGRNAKINRPSAGKTGTSQSLRDAWFVGFSSEMVAGVWFGNDNDSPMMKITGGTAPAILWGDFMEKAHKKVPIKNLGFNLLRDEKPENPLSKNQNERNNKSSKSESLFEKILENMFKR